MEMWCLCTFNTLWHHCYYVFFPWHLSNTTIVTIALVLVEQPRGIWIKPPGTDNDYNTNAHQTRVYIVWDILHIVTSSNEKSALVALCAGNSPVTGEFPAQMPETRSFDVIFDLHLIIVWLNNGEAGDLRRHRAHYDAIVIKKRVSGHGLYCNEHLSEWSLYLWRVRNMSSNLVIM